MGKGREAIVWRENTAVERRNRVLEVDFGSELKITRPTQTVEIVLASPIDLSSQKIDLKTQRPDLRALQLHTFATKLRRPLILQTRIHRRSEYSSSESLKLLQVNRQTLKRTTVSDEARQSDVRSAGLENQVAGQQKLENFCVEHDEKRPVARSLCQNIQWISDRRGQQSNQRVLGSWRGTVRVWMLGKSHQTRIERKSEKEALVNNRRVCCGCMQYLITFFYIVLITILHRFLYRIITEWEYS